MVQIREYYENKETGEKLPSKKVRASSLFSLERDTTNCV